MDHMAYDRPGAEPYLEPERMSLAAIFGFIFSLAGCCMGVTALLGAPLSVIALVNIGRSSGRLGGRGLAIAGLLISLLNIVVWGGCLGASFAGFGQLETRTFGLVEDVFTSLETGDYDAARAALGAPANASTDAELAAFHAAYASTLGEFADRPRGAAAYFLTFPEFGPWQAVVQNGQGNVPILMDFDSGQAMVMITVDPDSGLPGALAVYDVNLNEYTLPVQPGTNPADTTPAPPAPGADQPAETPAEDQSP